MAQPGTALTPPIFATDDSLLFSAYGFGWGYCSFTLPVDTVCKKLGAANETSRQLMLAFELGKVRLLQAVDSKTLPASGERITLSPDDL